MEMIKFGFITAIDSNETCVSWNILLTESDVVAVDTLARQLWITRIPKLSSGVRMPKLRILKWKTNNKKHFYFQYNNNYRRAEESM